MIGMQDESDIQCALGGQTELTVEHQQKISGVGQRAIRLNELESLADAIIAATIIAICEVRRMALSTFALWSLFFSSGS